MGSAGPFTPDDLPPTSLAALIELDDVVPQRVWREEELGAILAHELQTPPWVELGPLRVSGVSAAGIGSDGGGLLLATLGDLLHHPGVPLDLLVRLKEFAKSQRHDPASHLPEPVAAVLYALAVAAALVRHERRITRLDQARLLSHFEWSSSRAWLDPASRRLLNDAVARLRNSAVGEDRPDQ